ncbi:monovalent cation/H+ antiporter subunit D [Litorisediminicola beolgyonensis]|uniref:Monovalent cation/H+ antiporter subunit D n=1 Tax=Litorisediminicola beolgyonensis TaxID=1173614 RepID=A0ABW3ZIZ5_9RHOB
MSHWIIAPVALPALLAAFIVLVTRYHLNMQRVFSLAGTVALAIIGAGLFWRASDGTITLYQLGDWAAPFGIVLVGDRLSTLMVLLTSILAVCVLLHAIGTGWDKRGRHFHALFQFQIMGIMGAFLTGDIFNLFVFFEVLLIASYGLMIHSGGTPRVKAGTQYVLYNLLGSTLFLFALGALYAETGTLNMADLAGRVAAISPDASAGIRVAAVLLIMVFGVKAAIAPLQFWLPSSYAEAPGPVAALFAIMTKVGAYSIIRIYTLVFPPDLEVTSGLMGAWLLPVGLISLVIGMVGVLGAKRLDRLVAFSVIGSMGMLTITLGLFTEEGTAAALYYVVHSTFATAALFLIVDLVARSRGGLDLSAKRPVAGAPLLAGMFFAASIAMTGLPPLSGFLGKLLILDAAFASDWVVWAWAAILGSSLIAVVGFARAGSTVFWKSHAVAADLEKAPKPDPDARVPSLAAVAVGLLIALLVAHTVLAGPIMRVMSATSAQLYAPSPYITTVLDTPGKEIVAHGDDHGDGHGEDSHDDGEGGDDHDGGADATQGNADHGDSASEGH